MVWAWLACTAPTTTSPDPRHTAATLPTGLPDDSAEVERHSAEPTTETDPDVDLELFPRDRVLQVELELAPEDWDTLRFQDRDHVAAFTGDCLQAPFVSPYTEFPATVTIDGVRIEQVNLRKKGFMGSIDTQRPSLKVDFDDLVPRRDVGGADRMTLNNQFQDPSGFRSCLSAEGMAMLGIPASRCALAHVVVNGTDLGVYAEVSDVEDEVLPGFDLDDGQAYEGSASDLIAGFVHTFEPETPETDPALGPLLAVTDALVLPDDQLVAALDPLVDLPAVYRFWSAESILFHRDGYSGHRNNFWAVFPPGGRMTLIPTGMEATFGWDPGLPEPVGSPQILTDATLFWRLHEHPVTRAAFVAEHEAMLELWDEVRMNAEVDRLSALARPYVDAAEWAAAVADTHAFVDRREAVMRADLLTFDAPRTEPPPDPVCLEAAGPVSVTFETTWQGGPGGRSEVTDADGTFRGTAVVGPAGDGGMSLVLRGVDGQRRLQLGVAVAEMPRSQGAWSLPVGTMTTTVTWTRLDPTREAPAGWLGSGTLSLEAFGTNPGDPVRGTVSGTLGAIVPDLPAPWEE